MESEIRYLSEAFDEIIIFAINIKTAEKQTRIIPNNVKAFPLNCGHTKIINILRGFFHIGCTYHLPKNGLKNALGCLYTRGRFFRIFKKSLSILHSMNFDGNDTIFYSYWLNAALPCLELAKWYKQRGCKNVSTVSRGHGYDVYSERNQLSFLPFQREYIKELDEIDICSENGRDYLKLKYPEYVSKIFTAKLGTDDCGIEIYNPNNQKTLVTCSRFRKIKRIPMFVDAFSLVINKFPNCKWICIGSGEEEQIIKDLIKSLGIGKNVELTGRLSNKDVLTLYSETSVSFFVNISTEEGLPVSIMEAMSFGIPAIATNVGGTKEIVDDACGRLISANATIADIANAIIQELSLPEKNYLVKRAQSREKWLKNYSSNSNYAAWANHLKNSL